jgi:hypothetical protein
MPSTTEVQAASKRTVGVNVGSGVGVSVGVAVGVDVGRGVGVSGMISLVAARQAKVEQSRAVIQKTLKRYFSADIICESSTGWTVESPGFCAQLFQVGFILEENLLITKNTKEHEVLKPLP